MRCGEQLYEKQVDQKIDQVLSSLPELQDHQDEITLSFYQQNTNAINQGFFGQSSKKQIWEQWVIPLQLKSEEKNNSNEDDVEEMLREMTLDLIDKINIQNDYMPPMYEQLRCFPFEIDLKKTQQVKSGWLIGGLFRKLTS